MIVKFRIPQQVLVSCKPAASRGLWLDAFVPMHIVEKDVVSQFKPPRNLSGDIHHQKSKQMNILVPQFEKGLP
jgi:hypothetical protein